MGWHKQQSLANLHGKLLVGLGVHLVPEVLQSVEAVAVELGARSGGQQRPACNEGLVKKVGLTVDLEQTLIPSVFTTIRFCTKKGLVRP